MEESATQPTAAAEPVAESTAAPAPPVETAVPAPAPAAPPPDARDAFADGFNALPRDQRGRFAPRASDIEPAIEQAEPDPPATDVTTAATPEPPVAAEPAPPPEIPADVLSAAVERAIAEREQKAAAAAETQRQADEAATRVRERRESIFGTEGELASLLRKRAGWNAGTSDDPFTTVDDARLDELILNAERYEPYRAKAVEDAQADLERVAAEAEERVTNARGMTQKMLDGWGASIKEGAALDLAGLDTKTILDAPGVPDMLRHAHSAGAASRDDEVEHLKAQLAEAKASAFGSQPALVTAGGASPSGRGRPGLAADASPREAFAEAFAQQGIGSTRGRR